ncbi:MAG: SPOR domain-containing protein [Rhodobacter sp.]|nr:SPOR domain-containing protein [Rhodobacter sp.]
MLRTTSLTALALVLIIGAADAQSLRNADEPAEFPPASFTGKQYVDSKGCVFVRAGFDGAVTWVPRVTRNRKVLCGFQPTMAKPKPAAAPPVQVAAAPKPVPPKPKPDPVRVVAPPKPSPAPAPAPTRVRPTSAPTPVVVQNKPRSAPVVVQAAPPAQVRVKPAPVRIQTAAPAPLGTTTVASACPGGSALSQKYLRNGGGHKVRCGPQVDHPGAYATAGGTQYAAASGAIRVAPPPRIAPPPGYKPAFEQDRFNPYRGQQTREGFVQMRLVWTSGTPRRLIDRTTGRDVTKLFPNLRYPFVSMQQQRRYVAVNGPVVSTKNQPPAATANVRVSTKAVPPAQAAPPKRTPVRVTAPAKPTKPVNAGHRYVQVGTFSVESNARNTAARLKALGVPAKLASYSRGGKVYRIVVAGPYRDAGSLRAGLAAVRRAGFSDAYTRK